MNNRVVDILVYIVNEIKAKKGYVDNIDRIARDLVNKGYTEGEINNALSWLIGSVKANDIHSHSTFRILHQTEKAVITPQAFGYIIQLKELGLINSSEMEEIIEECMIGTKPVTLDEVKSIAASLVFEDGESEFRIHGGFYVADRRNIMH